MIALVRPSEKIKKIFYKDSDVIYIDHEGFWLYSKEKSARILLPNISDNTFGEHFNILRAKSYLNWWMPLFTRWAPNAEKYNLIRDELLILIYKIFIMFKFYNINSVIFFTSVAHHIPAAIISIVAQLKKAKQIYLYFEIINGRLLPLEQMGAIDTRVPINYELNNLKYNKNLELFIQNKINNKEPVHNLKEKAWKKSLIIAIAYLLKREISKIFIKLNFINTINKSIFITDSLKKFSFLEDLRAINSQRKYLKKLSHSIISEKKIHQLKKKGPYLLIAAHYQPEASSFPEGNNYNSHIDIILALRKKKYTSKILYKEHFGSFLYTDSIVGLTKVGISRSESYINILKNLGCVFLPVNFILSVNNNSNWYLPITITGTIAIERALAGLHTIYSGEPWYKGMPGTIHLDDIKSLEQIPLNWINYDPKIEKEAKKFLEKILNNKTIANAPGIGSGVKDFSLASTEDFKNGILKIIKNLKKEY